MTADELITHLENQGYSPSDIISILAHKLTEEQREEVVREGEEYMND